MTTIQRNDLALAYRERHSRALSTQEMAEQIRKWAMRRWIGRYRALMGPNRPLVVQLKAQSGVWVLPPGRGPQESGYWTFYRVNVQDASWELGSQQWSSPEAIVAILDPSERLVRRVWAKQVMRRLA